MSLYVWLFRRRTSMLGGLPSRAEDEIFDVVTTGAESDLQSATPIARQMVGRWGMSERIGAVQVYPVDADPRQIGASEALLAAVDDEVRRLIDAGIDRRPAQSQLVGATPGSPAGGRSADREGRSRHSGLGLRRWRPRAAAPHSGPAANLNVSAAGQTVAKPVMVPLGADGTVTLYTPAART